VDKDLLLTLLIDELHKSSKIEHQLLLLFVLIQYLEEIFIRPFVWTKFLEFCQSKLLLVRISSVTFLCVIHLSFIPFAAIIVFTSSFSYSSIRIYWQIPWLQIKMLLQMVFVKMSTFLAVEVDWLISHQWTFRS
jgi:hypothetical protein